jgi:hypothetical protein
MNLYMCSCAMRADRTFEGDEVLDVGRQQWMYSSQNVETGFLENTTTLQWQVLSTQRGAGHGATC